MTRFARSKGSKSSNERIPEAATPWHEISQQLQKSSSAHEKTKAEFDAQRKANYEKFLKDEAIKKSQESWCEFPGQSTEANEKHIPKLDKKRKVKGESEKKYKTVDSQTSQQLNKNDREAKSTKKKRKHKDKKHVDIESKRLDNNSDDEISFDADDPELSEWCDQYSNEETELKYKQLTEQLEILCDKAEKNNIKRKDVPQTSHVSKKNKRKNEDQCETNVNNVDTTVSKKRKNKKNKECNEAEVEEGTSKRKSKQNNIVNNPDIDNVKKFARRKPLPEKNYVIINGEEVEIVNIQGFPVTSKDANRILQLRKALISKGIPRSEVERTIKLERRKAEKSLARLKKNLCFHCRRGGHILSECPDINRDEKIGTMPVSGLCFKCGSTEHTHFNCKVVRSQEYKFAQCFICKEQGHISRQCPDNPRGIYPKGGACRVCGEVTHLRKDCPKVMQENDKKAIRLETLESNNIDDIETSATLPSPSQGPPPTKRAIKHVRF